MGELCGYLPLMPLTSRHRCDLPVRWSHLSMADCHLVRLFSTTSFWICLLRSLSVSLVSDFADAGRVGWQCQIRLAEIKKPPALFNAFLKVFEA